MIEVNQPLPFHARRQKKMNTMYEYTDRDRWIDRMFGVGLKRHQAAFMVVG